MSSGSVPGSATPTSEAWEIHASAALVFPSGRVLYPTRVVCGESLVGELALTLSQLDRFAEALGLRRVGSAAPLSAQALTFAPRPVYDRERLLDRVGNVNVVTPTVVRGDCIHPLGGGPLTIGGGA